jgi:hypothetical protein
MGNFELFKVSGKIRFKSSNQIYYTPESAFIELNPGWFSYENNNYVGTFKPKYTAKPLNLNSRINSVQFESCF